MRITLLAVGLLTTVTIHPALAQSTEDERDAGMPVLEEQGEVTAPPLRFEGPNRDAGPGPEGLRRHHRAEAPHLPQGLASGAGIGPHGFGMNPEVALASRLAMIETRIGIRSEQLDVWRDYTSALQALAPRPEEGPDGMPPHPEAATLDGELTPRTKPDTLARQERMAESMTKRATAASRLISAIAQLRQTLTPEQLELLTSMDLRLKPPLRGGPRFAAPQDGQIPSPESGTLLPRAAPPANGKL